VAAVQLELEVVAGATVTKVVGVFVRFSCAASGDGPAAQRTRLSAQALEATLLERCVGALHLQPLEEGRERDDCRISVLGDASPEVIGRGGFSEEAVTEYGRSSLLGDTLVWGTWRGAEQGAELNGGQVLQQKRDVPLMRDAAEMENTTARRIVPTRAVAHTGWRSVVLLCAGGLQSEQTGMLFAV
jgi:hypothetical protein